MEPSLVDPSQVDQVRVDQVARAAVAAHREERGPLLPVLHTVAHELGYIPEQAVPVIAQELNLSKADVHGVVSFYSDFRREPAGRVVVAVCQAEACQAVGARELMDDVAARLAVAPGTTRDDGAVTLGEVFCFGNCALGPAATVDGTLHGRLTVERLTSLVEDAL